MGLLSKAVFVLLFAGAAGGVDGWRGAPTAPAVPPGRAAVPSPLDCLPDGYSLTDVVSYAQKRKGSEEFPTLKDRLAELKARCKGGKLVDGRGREVRLFRVTCYGNPPENYEELKRQEQEELERLRKRYTVIVLPCDPRLG